MKIFYTAVENMVERGQQPDAAQLSSDELIMCFPGAVEVVGDKGARVRLPDAALFGLLSELASMWAELCAGNSSASRTDLDGAYNLSMRVSSQDHVLLREEWRDDEVSLVSGAFRDALATWSEAQFSSALRIHPTLAKNKNFAALKVQIDDHLSGRLARVLQ